MKKIYSIFALAAIIVTALCFSSCDGVSDQDASVWQETVVGTWRCESTDFGSLSEETAGVIHQGDRMSLKEDNTWNLEAKGRWLNGTWSIDSKNENLKIISPDMTMNFKVTELTASKMSCYLYISGHTLKYTFIRI